MFLLVWTLHRAWILLKRRIRMGDTYGTVTEDFIY